MTISVIIISILILAMVVYKINRKTKYYRKIFHDEHYNQILEWIEEEIHKLNNADQPSNYHSSLKSDAGVILVLTNSANDGKVALQLSVSEARGVTTHAIAGRILFLIITALNKNRASAELFYTDSTIHYLVLIVEPGILKVTDRNVVLAEMKNYRPLSFDYRSVEK